MTRAPLRPAPPPLFAQCRRELPAPNMWKDEVQEAVGEPYVQTPEVIEAMREASAIAADALQLAGETVAPGVTTDEIDRVVHDYMCDHGAYPSPPSATAVFPNPAAHPSMRLSATAFPTLL